MDIIEAKNLGVYFRLREPSEKRFRGMLESFINPKRKQAYWALDDINFTLKEGEILGVIGNNGAGKSTLLRTIAGVYKPDKGMIQVNGTISPLLSLGTGFKMELSGMENIFLNGAIMGFEKDEVIGHLKDIIEFSELYKFIHQPVKTYSSGMRARLGFSIAAFLQRDVMLIDEILGVGDFKFRKKSQEKIQELISESRTIVIVSHDLKSITKYATKALWIDQGKQVMMGETQEVVENYLAG